MSRTRIRRPAAFRRAGHRIANLVRPGVNITPAPDVRAEYDVAVPVRDGTILRLNIFHPDSPGPHPVIMSAHPYGKDRMPVRGRGGRAIDVQYRIMPQPDRVRFSELTSWEAPDPAIWTAHGYVVVNADLRGGGTSEGIGSMFTTAEAQDYFDLIEWVGTQPWCTGRVGLDGVSYLALSQYRVAELRPPHLAALCVWEGFSDFYRDFAYPGGVREDGFSRLWSAVTARRTRMTENLRTEILRRPDRDDWYTAHTPTLERIQVPMLVCASFSDHNLHSRGSFEAFRRAGSTRKWLYTHRDGKWSHYYGAEATRERIRFFDHVLRDADNGWDSRPAVRLAVHAEGARPADITYVDDWPPSDTKTAVLHLNTDGQLTADPETTGGQRSFRSRRAALAWTWTAPEDIDILGPSTLRLHVALADADDMNLFVVLRKFRDGREVCFEGSYGFNADVVTKGWQRLAHRTLDPALSTPLQPVHTHHEAEPLTPGVPVAVDVALLPHATRIHRGEQLRLEIGGRWAFARDPLRGQFPGWYRQSPNTTCSIHTGPDQPATLTFAWRPAEVEHPEKP
ncbi:CocE/NonD family hydrolase [Nocardia tengchongensis]|uniref:CocE/NonD family hydrolase n=1 Tax=Nocardia tengchongensis TaxID=2055889 RepID=UPI00369A995A